MNIVPCCNGSELCLHRKSEGSTPSGTTINNIEGPQGVSGSLGAIPLFDFLEIDGKTYKIGWDLSPIEDSYSIDWYF